jgi:hypothetical protein
MHDETLELQSLWTGWLWSLGVAGCRWPLAHPIAAEAASARARRDRELRRAARLLTHVAGHGACCERAMLQALRDLVEIGPWGDSAADVRSIAGAAVRAGSPPADDSDLMHRAMVGSLERFLEEAFRLRTLAWEHHPARVERTAVSRLAVVGAVAAWIVQPRWRGVAGAETVRRAMKRIVDGRHVLDLLEGGAPPGLERCVVEVHYWLRTGELGQQWMPQWQAPA